MSDNIYYGLRGEVFKNLLYNILKKSNLKEKYINILLSEKNLSEYNKAFTSLSSNTDENYEVYEQLGDLSINKFIVHYCYKRFPQLNCHLGVKIIARLRINYASKNNFSEIGDQLKFWDFITASHELRNQKRKDLLEDCFEAFIGCTEKILDDHFMIGVGYAIVYDILTSIFNSRPMSIKYEDLFDAKTRLKELFQFYNKDLGSEVYISQKINTVTGDVVNPNANNHNHNIITKTSVYMVPTGIDKKPIRQKILIDGIQVTLETPHPNWFFLAYGKGAIVTTAKQNAAARALEVLKNQGWTKEIPNEYKFFCN